MIFGPQSPLTRRTMLRGGGAAGAAAGLLGLVGSMRPEPAAAGTSVITGDSLVQLKTYNGHWTDIKTITVSPTTYLRAFVWVTQFNSSPTGSSPVALTAFVSSIVHAGGSSEVFGSQDVYTWGGSGISSISFGLGANMFASAIGLVLYFGSV